jgi:pimeloyl-ACP methyl ester carboxylesterase
VTGGRAAAEGALTEAEFSVDGRRVHYVREGAGDRTFVLIHGYAADHTTWMFNQPELVKAGVVYAMDLPGGGRSSLDVGSGDVGFFAGIVTALLDAAGIARAELVGHSFGASIAVAVTEANSGRVSALSLVAPGGLDPYINMDFISGFPRAKDKAAARRMLELLIADPRMISPEMLRIVVDYTNTPGVTEALDAVAAGSFPGRQAWLYRDRLAGLGVPTRIVWGADDRILRPVTTDLPAAIPVDVIPKSAHLVHLEASRAVNRLILASPASAAQVSQSRA